LRPKSVPDYTLGPILKQLQLIKSLAESLSKNIS
jgi:hypothetical protein